MVDSAFASNEDARLLRAATHDSKKLPEIASHTVLQLTNVYREKSFSSNSTHLSFL